MKLVNLEELFRNASDNQPVTVDDALIGLTNDLALQNDLELHEVFVIGSRLSDLDVQTVLQKVSVVNTPTEYIINAKLH